MTDAQRYQKILDAVRAVPPGRVSSYGRIAEDAGLPRRARLVGKVLSQLGSQDDVPWHRIVHADGRLAFPPDTDAHNRQADLLGEEGVEVRNGRVAMQRYAGQIDLDELLWRK